MQVPHTVFAATGKGSVSLRLAFDAESHRRDAYATSGTLSDRALPPTFSFQFRFNFPQRQTIHHV